MSKSNGTLRQTVTVWQEALEELRAALKGIGTLTARENPHEEAASDEYFESLLREGRRMRDAIAEVVSVSDRLWQQSDAAVIDFLEKQSADIVNGVAGSSDATMMTAAATAQEAVAATLSILNSGRSDFAKAISGMLASNPMLPAEVSARAGALLKAGLTDLVPFYGTMTTVLKVVFDVDVDGALWRGMAAPARRSFAISIPQKLNLQFDMAFLFAQSAEKSFRSAVGICGPEIARV